MTKQQYLNIIQKYIGNIGNNPVVRKEQEDCAEDLYDNCENEFEIGWAIKDGLTNPHDRKDLEDCKQKIYDDIIKWWKEYHDSRKDNY